jgi:thioesterase domain-containing protein
MFRGCRPENRTPEHPEFFLYDLFFCSSYAVAINGVKAHSIASFRMGCSASFWREQLARESLQEARRSVHALVSDYIGQIRMIQPKGPYHLLGWSFGGAVAQAMAAELERQGEPVALLALLDSHKPQSYRGSQITPDEQDFEKQIYGLAVSHFGEKLTSIIGESVLKILIKVAKNNIRIVKEFSWPVYQGGALLFRATMPSNLSIQMLSVQAWEPYVLGKIEVHDIHCRHEDIDQPQPMAEIGRVLAQNLGS